MNSKFTPTIATPFGQLFIVAVTIACLVIACDAPQSSVNAPPSPPKPQPSSQCRQMVYTALMGSYAGRDKTIACYYFVNKASISPLDLNFMVLHVNSEVVKDIITSDYYTSMATLQVEAK